MNLRLMVHRSGVGETAEVSGRPVIRSRHPPHRETKNRTAANLLHMHGCTVFAATKDPRTAMKKLTAVLILIAILIPASPGWAGDSVARAVAGTTPTGAGSATPLVTAAPSDATRISAGERHTCALTESGGAKCWGWNGTGQLGDGTKRPYRRRPADVAGLTSGVAAISAGYLHTCAVTDAGEAKCWGYNRLGQVGDGTTDDRRTPVDVAGLTRYVAAIAAGVLHTCALTDSGRVKCWGDNSEGELGDGTTDDSLEPVPVSGLGTDVVGISTGWRHTCALTEVGGVKCWGANNSGQLGDGSPSERRLTPVDVTGLTSGVVAISAGGSHTCALTDAGGIWCWGSNLSGALGDGSGMARRTPVRVHGLSSGVAQIAGGSYHTCAVTAAGEAKCWGLNDAGQLGIGTTNDQPTPVTVAGLRGGIAAIAPGESHTCALTTAGAAHCWGANDYAQLGNGRTSERHEPVDVAGLTTGAAAISADPLHACAVMDSGRARCWGDNDYGQLGDGTTSDRSTPVRVDDLRQDVVATSGGQFHTCALTHAGRVKCWGGNFQGQLGDGTRRQRLSPVVVSGLRGVVEISAGGYHTCAVTDAGGVKCWGSILRNRTTPSDVAGLTSGVAATSGGESHACALTDAGRVKCWGLNDFGQLGDGTTRDRAVPVRVGGLGSGVAAISAGWHHTCAITETGAVKCWGENVYGQLGDGTTRDRHTPVHVGGLGARATAISAGLAHTCVLTESGRMKCWGNDNYGQLGDGNSGDAQPPVTVSNLGTTVVAISAGGFHTCALTEGGRATCWGLNDSGQVGDGTPTWVPGDVVGFP